MMKKPIKVISIVGPTASGKTKIAVELCQKFNGEIISADSRQIYIGLDIGTAKEGKLEYRQTKVVGKQPVRVVSGIPQYCIDIVRADETFTMVDFQRFCRKVIQDIAQRGKIPFVVGGTGLYVDAVLKGYQAPPTTQVLDGQWFITRKDLEKKSVQEIRRRLKEVDLKSAQTIDPQNKRRLIRAYEVFLLTGRPFSSLKTQKKPNYRVLWLGIDLPREKLYQKINKRTEDQFAAGLVDEVRRLAKKYAWDLPSMSGIGYKELGLYLKGLMTKDEAMATIKQAARNYARRQLTWFRRNKDIHWVKNYTGAEKLVSRFLTKD